MKSQGLLTAPSSRGAMTTPPPQPTKPQLPALILPKDLEIEYVNLARIAHSPTEIVYDFAQILPGGSPARITSRIVMTPVAAKLFSRALVENLQKYEAQFGEIKIPGDVSLADHLFKPKSE